jgi:hypothetical protein
MAASTWTRASIAAPDAALAAAETFTLGNATEPNGAVEALGEHAATAIATATPMAAVAAAAIDRWMAGRPSRRIPYRSVVAVRGATSCVFIGRPYGARPRERPPDGPQNIETGSQLRAGRDAEPQ